MPVLRHMLACCRRAAAVLLQRGAGTPAAAAASYRVRQHNDTWYDMFSWYASMFAGAF